MSKKNSKNKKNRVKELETKNVSNKLSMKRMFSNDWFLLKIALQEAPLFTIHGLLGRAKHRVVVFIEHTYMVGYIINCIQYGKPFSDVFWFITGIFIFLVLFVQFPPNIFDARIKPKSMEKIKRRIRLELYEKASYMDLKRYDDPEFYNEFVWAMSEATDRVIPIIDTYAILLGEIIGILVVGGYMLTQDVLGIVLTICSVGMILFVSNLYNKLKLSYAEKLKPLERKRDYISRVFYLQDYAKEIRMSNVKTKLYEEFEETSRQMEEITKRETRKICICGFVMDFVGHTFIFEGIYIIYLLFKTIVQGAFGYGTMIILYNSCSNLKSCSMSLARVLPQFTEHGRYIEKIRYFLEIPSELEEPEDAKEPEDFQELRLEDVGFSYSDGRPVLKNLNLAIQKGERIALVGYNGAGKTTLVKLLMRLYDVSDGKITWNGSDVREMKKEAYRQKFATLFQDYQLFAATLGENIVMDTDPISKKKAEPVLQRSGFAKKFAKLDKGYDTPLTREFEEDGTLLSGGESQMVGICRALYQDSEIIILDEPSSALDPLSEYNLNHTMMNLERDKTVIFISHRLSTTRLADRIYMLEDGQIVESGSHEELMRQNGKYAQMFQLQMEKYR